MSSDPNRQLRAPMTRTQDFEWRANAGRWRWLILSALGAVPNACGGQAEPTDTDSNGVNLSNQGGTSGGGHQGGTPGSAGPVVQPSVGGATSAAPEPVPVALACQNPSPLGGNWLRCDNGMLHRGTVGECPSSVPRPEPVTIPAAYAQYPDAGQYSSCRDDGDCNERPYGHCDFAAVQIVGTFCNYGCVVDADCGAGQVCLCGEPVGHCAEARCATDADCAAGQLCGDYVTSPGCGGIGFACQSAQDECAGPSDCPGPNYNVCTLERRSDGTGLPGSRRVCSGPQCAIGRPFLIAGRERLAPPLARADWYSATANAAAPSLDLDAGLRAELARSWTEQALMEHASVAAFARFSMQLLSLGAPPDLVLRSAQAMQDEIGHARSCFELARHYSGSDVGPGPLPLDGALDESDLCSVVLGTIAEGCIGETVAALEAAEALAHCEDAKVRELLGRISIEESRHAELAWQFVAWALATGPSSLAPRVREAFDAALTSPVPQPVPPSSLDRELLRHGVVSVGLRRALRERVLGEVIAPCARALLERAQPAESTALHERASLAQQA